MDFRYVLRIVVDVDFQRSQVCATPIWCLAAITTHSFCAGTDSGAVFFLDFIGDQLNVIRTVNIGTFIYILRSCDVMLIGAVSFFFLMHRFSW